MSSSSWTKILLIQPLEPFSGQADGQLSGRKSLHDITGNPKAQGKRLYHLGMKPTATATLTRVNAGEPASLYQEIFSMLLHRCRRLAPKHRHFKADSICSISRLYSFSLPPFPRLNFVRKKRHQAPCRPGSQRLSAGLPGMTKGKRMRPNELVSRAVIGVF